MILRLLLVLLLSHSLLANASDSLDYRLSAEKIAADTYVFIGAKEDFTRENGGNIVNTAFIVTAEGVVLIDSGPSLRYGQQVRQVISKITDKPIIRVLITHHHPDHFLGNQAYQDVPIFALSHTIDELKRDAAGFLDNVYRMAGDWMKGTEVSISEMQPLSVTQEQIADHRFRYFDLSGHTASDLMILDETTGVLFAGDLVFHNRTLTTPHADPEQWLKSLDAITQLDFKLIVPGHGEVASDSGPVEQTRDYLLWLEATIRDAVNKGLAMNEVLALPIPDRFSKLAVLHREFTRSVSHRYPVYEQQIFNTPH